MYMTGWSLVSRRSTSWVKTVNCATNYIGILRIAKPSRNAFNGEVHDTYAMSQLCTYLSIY